MIYVSRHHLATPLTRCAALALLLLGGTILAPGARAQTSAPPPAAAAPQSYEGPAYVVLYVEAQANATGKVLSVIRQYRDASRKEGANRGVQIIQEMGRPNRLALVEAWTDQAAFEAHDKSSIAALRDKLKPIVVATLDRRLNHSFAGAGGALPGRGAIYVVSHIDVNPPNRPTTEPILKQLTEDGHKDKGNLLFEVYQQNGALNHYAGVTAWRDRKSFESYEKMAHATAARAGLAPLLGALYDERLYRVVE